MGEEELALGCNIQKSPWWTGGAGDKKFAATASWIASASDDGLPSATTETATSNKVEEESVKASASAVTPPPLPSEAATQQQPLPTLWAVRRAQQQVAEHPEEALTWFELTKLARSRREILDRMEQELGESSAQPTTTNTTSSRQIFS